MSIEQDYRIFLVTLEGPQATLLANYVEDKSGVVTRIMSPDLELEKICSGGAVGLIMVDKSVVSLSHLHRCQENVASIESEGRKPLMLSVFNLESEEQANELLSSVYLQGVFFQHDSLDLMAQGIKCILGGELWASRRLTSQVIDNLRRQHLNIYRQTGNLTTRERQILGLVGMGASNLEIAERLFLSQHTVKSHIYNIFKKIGVRNRTQAVGWAHDQLGLPVTSLTHSANNSCIT